MYYFIISFRCTELALLTNLFKPKFVFSSGKEIFFNTSKMPFYAVASGRIPGVYKTW